MSKQKYEYKVFVPDGINNKDQTIEQFLNEIAKEGWRLIEVVRTQGISRYFFEREISEVDVMAEATEEAWSGDLTEGKVRKGGTNKRPETPRPPPPKGQG